MRQLYTTPQKEKGAVTDSDSLERNETHSPNPTPTPTPTSTPTPTHTPLYEVATSVKHSLHGYLEQRRADNSQFLLAYCYLNNEIQNFTFALVPEVQQPNILFAHSPIGTHVKIAAKITENNVLSQFCKDRNSGDALFLLRCMLNGIYDCSLVNNDTPCESCTFVFEKNLNEENDALITKMTTDVNKQENRGKMGTYNAVHFYQKRNMCWLYSVWQILSTTPLFNLLKDDFQNFLGVVAFHKKYFSEKGQYFVQNMTPLWEQYASEEDISQHEISHESPYNWHDIYLKAVLKRNGIEHEEQTIEVTNWKNVLTKITRTKFKKDITIIRLNKGNLEDNILFEFNVSKLNMFSVDSFVAGFLDLGKDEPHVLSFVKKDKSITIFDSAKTKKHDHRPFQQLVEIILIFYKIK